MPSTDLSQKYWQEIKMFLDTKATLDGIPVVIIIRRTTEERLAGTCFRGKSKKLAGNFCLWENGLEFFADISVRSGFLREIQEAYWVGDKFNSVCIDLTCVIGWAGTDKEVNYNCDDLEWFNPNRKSCALRVKPGSRHLYAPQTRSVTIVYEIKEEDDKIVVIVHSIYPGEDIGELSGNITESESCVFFDWNHPGAPL